MEREVGLCMCDSEVSAEFVDIRLQGRDSCGSVRLPSPTEISNTR